MAKMSKILWKDFKLSQNKISRNLQDFSKVLKIIQNYGLEQDFEVENKQDLTNLQDFTVKFEEYLISNCYSTSRCITTFSSTFSKHYLISKEEKMIRKKRKNSSPLLN